MIKKFFILFVSVNLIAESIVIDGNLDEPEWQTAFKITEFYESDPYTLRKTDDETEAYIFSNEDGIYVGFINYQDESTMLSNRTMRDEMSSLSEKNSINIDFDGDRTKAYIIAVALGDSLFDAIKIQSGDFKTDWDGDWIAKTKQFKTYWTSEFYLPWNFRLDICVTPNYTNNTQWMNALAGKDVHPVLSIAIATYAQMGLTNNSNWNVVLPLADWIMKTNK